MAIKKISCTFLNYDAGYFFYLNKLIKETLLPVKRGSILYHQA